VYVDTSVFGGYFDSLYEAATVRFIGMVRDGAFALVTSALVASEVAGAPQCVRDLYDGLLPTTEVVAAAQIEAVDLAQAYLSAGILTPKWQDDAFHVAYASITRCELIVSWNFRHIVNYRKIPAYNAINIARGYGAIAIYSPQEVINDEEERV
jgi:hypothetical protein